MSNKTIPDEVLQILQYGPKFAYIDPKKLPVNILIADIENIIHKLPEDTKTEWNVSPQMKLIKKTNQFLKNNQDLFILNADKCNKTVIMTKNEYQTKINTLINDPNTYSSQNHDPILTLQNKINNIVASWYKNSQKP